MIAARHRQRRDRPDRQRPDQIEKRLERVAKDMKKAKTPETEREHALLLRCKAQTEAGKRCARWN